MELLTAIMELLHLTDRPVNWFRTAKLVIVLVVLADWIQMPRYRTMHVYVQLAFTYPLLTHWVAASEYRHVKLVMEEQTQTAYPANQDIAWQKAHRVLWPALTGSTLLAQHVLNAILHENFEMEVPRRTAYSVLKNMHGFGRGHNLKHV